MSLYEPAVWAQQQFGTAKLGDRRRTRRLVQVAAAMAHDPDGSLPRQLQNWGDLKAAYRLFDCAQATFDAVAAPHQSLRHECGPGRFLVLNDTTELNFTWQRHIPGLGPLGAGQGYGWLLHSALLLSTRGDLLGLAGQTIACRRPRTTRRTRTESLRQARESQFWTEVIDRVGPPPEGAEWIHLADRAADNFEVYHHCRRQCCGFVIRARCRTRRLLIAGDQTKTLDQLLKSLPVAGTTTVEVPARRPDKRIVGHSHHTAVLEVSFCACRMPPPRLRSPDLRGPDVQPIPMQIVFVHEVHPPAGDAPVEWILYTSLPVESLAQALEVIRYYQQRWVIEEWHKALKTGCRVTSRQLQTRDRLEPLIALLCVQAVRLVALRNLARSQPHLPAAGIVPPIALEVLHRHRGSASAITTLRTFVHAVAALGGFLGRTHDGEPGWQTLWAGWERLTQLIDGYRLAHPPPSCG